MKKERLRQLNELVTSIFNVFWVPDRQCSILEHMTLKIEDFCVGLNLLFILTADHVILTVQIMISRIIFP